MATKTIDQIISGIIDAEGREYTNNANDAGGPTKFGITLATLSSWRGHAVTAEDVQALTEDEARKIYAARYWIAPGFSLLAPISMPIAAECCDTGVNMGSSVAATFLQRSLNALNLHGTKYAEIVVDGRVGSGTAAALAAFIGWRGAAGELVMLKALNCLQGARYIEITEQREKNEDFLFGWLNERVTL